MSKLADNLQRNESVVLEAKVHWAQLIIPSIFTILFLAADWRVGLIVGLIFVLPRVADMMTTELAVSNKRLVGKYGFINTKQMDSPLNKINSISVESGLLGKIFGYATITVNTASTIYMFKNIAQAETFKHNTLQAMDKFDEDRIKEQAKALAGAMNN